MQVCSSNWWQRINLQKHLNSKPKRQQNNISNNNDYKIYSIQAVISNHISFDLLVAFLVNSLEL